MDGKSNFHMLLLIFFGIFLLSLISYVWVRGIDFMHKNHPNYKGEDFLHWGDYDVTKTAGRDGWDDNLVHTEYEI